VLGTLGLPSVLIQEGGYDLASLETDLAALLTGFGEALA